MKKFSTSCSLPSLVELAPGDYPKELLSVRLSGHEIKEALLIILLDNVRKQTPVTEPPKWFPADLVSCSGDAIIDRWNFLIAKSKKLTMRERRHGVPMEMFTGTEPTAQAGKRKLSLDQGEENPRPAKVARTFTSTPEELVKLCGAFAQATSAACNSRLTPVKTMENLIDRFERARDKQTQMAASVSTGQQQVAEAAAGDQPAAGSAGGAAAVAIAPRVEPVPPKAPVSNNSRGGGGRGGRGNRGRGGRPEQRTPPVQVSGGPPVRCSHPAPDGTGYCMTPNFPEAVVCRRCGGNVSHQGPGSSNSVSK